MCTQTKYGITMIIDCSKINLVTAAHNGGRAPWRAANGGRARRGAGGAGGAGRGLNMKATVSIRPTHVNLLVMLFVMCGRCMRLCCGGHD